MRTSQQPCASRFDPPCSSAKCDKASYVRLHATAWHIRVKTLGGTVGTRWGRPYSWGRASFTSTSGSTWRSTRSPGRRPSWPPWAPSLTLPIGASPTRTTPSARCGTPPSSPTCAIPLCAFLESPWILGSPLWPGVCGNASAVYCTEVYCVQHCPLVCYGVAAMT
jgi:hypothetical protein